MALDLDTLSMEDTRAAYYAMGYSAASNGGFPHLSFHTELGFPRHGECEAKYREGYLDRKRKLKQTLEETK